MRSNLGHNIASFFLGMLIMALLFLYPGTFAKGGKYLADKLNAYFTDPHCPNGYRCDPVVSPSPNNNEE